MSWTLAACIVEQYPKEEPVLVALPANHVAMRDFESIGIPGAMLHGSATREVVRAATSLSGYGDVFPWQLDQLRAAADWAAAQDSQGDDLAGKLRQFLEVCERHGLAFTMN